ncbi:hypothetical protein QJS66_14935 [Kocuria rhizophila]|nr:hypothetical protein QJS66_14935 [Kocuria rhizophila]
MDHFLGMPSVLDIVGLRFANRLFEPISGPAARRVPIEIVFDETLGAGGPRRVLRLHRCRTGHAAVPPAAGRGADHDATRPSRFDPWRCPPTPRTSCGPPRLWAGVPRCTAERPGSPRWCAAGTPPERWAATRCRTTRGEGVDPEREPELWSSDPGGGHLALERGARDAALRQGPRQPHQHIRVTSATTAAGPPGLAAPPSPPMP